MNPHVRLSVGLLFGRLISEKGGKLHFHAHIRGLLLSLLIQRPSFHISSIVLIFCTNLNINKLADNMLNYKEDSFLIEASVTKSAVDIHIYIMYRVLFQRVKPFQ